MLGTFFSEWIPVILFFSPPVVTMILFLASLGDYRKANRTAQADPGSIARDKLKNKRTLTIVLGVIAGCLTLSMVGILALAYMAVAFM